MSKVNLRIHGTFNQVHGVGAKKINAVLKQKMEIAMDIITDEVHKKAKEYALGVDIPFNIDPNQKKNISVDSTGNLSNQIFKYIKQRHGLKWESIITAFPEYASFVEWGTGEFGPYRTPIIPTNEEFLHFKTYDGKWIRTRSVRGQEPKPFLRGAKWWMIDNVHKRLRTHMKQLKQTERMAIVSGEVK